MHDYKDRPEMYDTKTGDRFTVQKNDWVLYVITGFAVYAVINAVIQVANTW